MNWLALALGLVGLAALGAIAYWQLIIAEGTYLGSRVVVLMYDLSARYYERIKQYDVGAEQWYLGLPLTLALDRVPEPFVLDVATGTGRLPRALLRQQAFDGQVIGLDLSRRMLAHAVRNTSQFSDRLTYIWQDARYLPFHDDIFDAVTCLEALEFTPRPAVVLAELVRVLRPGGVLLVTNRVGPQARFLPAKAFASDELFAILRGMGMEDLTLRQWQVDYDLIWAVKSGVPWGGGMRPLAEAMRCPRCGGAIQAGERAMQCDACDREYPIAEDGVIEMAR